MCCNENSGRSSIQAIQNWLLIGFLISLILMVLTIAYAAWDRHSKQNQAIAASEAADIAARALEKQPPEGVTWEVFCIEHFAGSVPKSVRQKEVTDLVMPDYTGKVTFQRIDRNRPFAPGEGLRTFYEVPHLLIYKQYKYKDGTVLFSVTESTGVGDYFIDADRLRKTLDGALQGYIKRDMLQERIDQRK